MSITSETSSSSESDSIDGFSTQTPIKRFEGDPMEAFRKTVSDIVQAIAGEKKVKVPLQTEESLHSFLLDFLLTVHIPDCESFCKHRYGLGSENVTLIKQDVLLCARKAPQFLKKLKKFQKRR